MSQQARGKPDPGTVVFLCLSIIGAACAWFGAIKSFLIADYGWAYFFFVGSVATSMIVYFTIGQLSKEIARRAG